MCVMHVEGLFGGAILGLGHALLYRRIISAVRAPHILCGWVCCSLHRRWQHRNQIVVLSVQAMGGQHFLLRAGDVLFQRRLHFGNRAQVGLPRKLQEEGTGALHLGEFLGAGLFLVVSGVGVALDVAATVAHPCRQGA